MTQQIIASLGQQAVLLMTSYEGVSLHQVRFTHAMATGEDGNLMR